MATAVHSRAAKVYYDHYRVSPWASETSISFDADSAETTALENDYKSFIQGKASANGSTINGFMDIESGGFDQIEFADINDGKHFIARMPQGSSIGSIAYETVEASTGVARVMAVADKAVLNWAGQGTNQFYRGFVLTAGEQAFTATGEGTGVNCGASTATAPAQRFEVVIRVVSVSGAGTISVQIQESSDNGSGDAYADITLSADSPTHGTVSFIANAAVFATVGTIKLYTTAATEAWKRVQISALAGFTSVSLIVTCGIADAR